MPYSIDEVHLLASERGTKLEEIMARLHSSGVEFRTIALSGTLADPAALVQWIGTNVSEEEPVVSAVSIHSSGSWSLIWTSTYCYSTSSSARSTGKSTLRSKAIHHEYIESGTDLLASFPVM